MHMHLAVSVMWGPLVSGGRGYLQLMRVAHARAVQGARLPWIYKSGEREGGVPYLNT
jgi:hypothetical protein